MKTAGGIHILIPTLLKSFPEADLQEEAHNLKEVLLNSTDENVLAQQTMWVWLFVISFVLRFIERTETKRGNCLVGRL